MAQKNEAIFHCNKCGAQFPKWQGRCSECGVWGSVSGESGVASGSKSALASDLVSFDDIAGADVRRMAVGIGEFDQVLGGGVVPGSLVLVGGEPGIGKSTLILQAASKMAAASGPVLYVSGEESAQQVKMRMDRLGIGPKGMKFLGETDMDKICATVAEHEPSLAVIDSIQTMYSAEIPSAAGSINQVRACTVKLLQRAKKSDIPIFVIGHVTKEGTVAGPKTLEHLVDTVLYLEGDRYHNFRMLRTIKNRFGSTNEVGVFEMGGNGLVEVKNPSEAFLQERQEASSGTAITAVMEGNRTFLVEIQALVSKTHYGYPQRKSSGFDLNRLELLIAVLSKRCGLDLAGQDVLVNIAGGVKMTEPAVDLAVCMAIISAYRNRIIDPKTVVFGEIGLGGEVRPVPQARKRINEAEKLGFGRALVPFAKSKEPFSSKIEVGRIRHLREVLDIVKKGKAATSVVKEE